MYDFTLGLAAFAPPTLDQRHVLAAIASDQSETGRFLGAFAGIAPADEYFTLGTMVRILGPRGIRKRAAAKADQPLASMRTAPSRPAEDTAEPPHPGRSGHQEAYPAGLAGGSRRTEGNQH